MAQCHDQYEFPYRPGPVGSVVGAQCHDPTAVGDEPIDLTLARCVRDWADAVNPGDECTTRCAVQEALAALAGGASVTEAFAEARKLVLCRLRHPSRRPVRPPAPQHAA